MTQNFRTFDDVRRFFATIAEDVRRENETRMLVDDLAPDTIDAILDYQRDAYAAAIDRAIVALQAAGIREAADAPDPHFSLANVDVRPVPIE